MISFCILLYGCQTALHESTKTEASRSIQSFKEPYLEGSFNSGSSDFKEDFFFAEEYLPEKYFNFFTTDKMLSEISDPFEEELIETQFDIPIVRNNQVERYIKYFQDKGRKHFTRWLERSTTYLPYIIQEFEKEHMPKDLAYLAMIESGFNVKAYSRRHASGMWQFIKSTAKRYGLRVDWWVDERRDLEKSTQAAISYLKELQEEFGSWYLAAAAYNAGEGRIRRAIRKNGSNEFWKINKRRHLKWETINYVPKLIAAVIIAKNPEEYGFHSINWQEPINYETVMVSGATDLNIIANCCGTTLREIKRLNPALKRGCTPPFSSNYEVHIPEGTKMAFQKNIAAIHPSKRITFRRHVVKIGDTISEIALKYGTPQKAILAINGIRNPHRIVAGKNLVIPVPVNSRNAVKHQSKKKEIAAAMSLEPGTIEIVYRVVYGDTLWDIARAYNLDIAEIKRWNNLKSNIIHPGRELKLCLKEDDLS